MFLISVIVPIFNVEKYILNTILSIINQTDNDFELVLVNDGSTDNSIEIAVNACKNRNKDYKLVNQKNKGVSFARNIGIDSCSGEYFICIDGDDIICNEFISSIKKVIVKEKVDIIGIMHKRIKSVKDEIWIYKKKVIYKRYENNTLIDKYYKREIILASPALIINKNLIKKYNIKYNEKVIFSEDVLYVWECLRNFNNWIIIYNKMYGYLIRPNSTMTSSNLKKILNGYEAFKLYDFEKNIKSNVANQIFPRWILGVIRVSTKLLEINEFRELVNITNSKYELKKLDKNIGWKMIIEKKLLIISETIFYYVNRYFIG